MALIPHDSPVRWNCLLLWDIVSVLVSLIALPALALFAIARWPQEGTKYTTATLLCLTVSTMRCLGSSLLIYDQCYFLDFSYIIAATMLVHTRTNQTQALCSAHMVVCKLLNTCAEG